MLGKPEVARKRGLMAHTRGVVKQLAKHSYQFPVVVGDNMNITRKLC